jgi:hypothetical protein
MTFKQTKRSRLFIAWTWILASSLHAGTANVRVWVRDADAGGAVKNANLVVLAGSDTVAVSTTRDDAPALFALSFSPASVERREAALPSAAGIVETYPNPCADRVTLAVKAGAGRVRLYDVLGRQVFSGELEGLPAGGAAVEMAVKDAPNGLYLVRIEDGSGVTANGKFLKLGLGVSIGSIPFRLAGVRPLTAASAGPAFRKTAVGTPYTFTAFTSRATTGPGGVHAAGFVSAAVVVTGDTTIDLRLEKVPFSECGQNLAPRSEGAVTVDGLADEPVWERAAWGPIHWLWLGDDPAPEDFTGRYKLAWTPERLFVLAEIRDDVVSDQFPDPFSQYYMDDCLECFIDENASGGNHQYNNNAFAYHVALDGHAMDVGPTGAAVDYSSHVQMARTEAGDVSLWEIGLKVFPDTFAGNEAAVPPVALAGGKIMGFMVAYCDNDGTYDRESFIGSIAIAGADKNRGWIDASVFGTLELLP